MISGFSLGCLENDDLENKDRENEDSFSSESSDFGRWFSLSRHPSV